MKEHWGTLWRNSVYMTVYGDPCQEGGWMLTDLTGADTLVKGTGK